MQFRQFSDTKCLQGSNGVLNALGAERVTRMDGVAKCANTCLHLSELAKGLYCVLGVGRPCARENYDRFEARNDSRIRGNSTWLIVNSMEQTRRHVEMADC